MNNELVYPSPSPSVDQILEQTIKEIGIPPRPVIMDRIETEMRKGDPNFKHLGHLIGADVGLSAGLIKTANSAYFGTRSPVRSVDEALMRLGLNIANRAIAGISLRKAFPTNIQLDRFWHASAQIAALSGWLAQSVVKPKIRPDDAHTYGLFRDAGIPVLLIRFAQYRQTIIRANNEMTDSFVDIEHQDLPTNHAMIGCLLAQNWWLPEEICLAIRHHHEFQFSQPLEIHIPPASRYLIAVAQTAEHILQQVTGESRTCEWGKLGAACMHTLDIKEGDLSNIYEEAINIIKSVD
jgi:HD-like signal output (HDOD) protein